MRLKRTCAAAVVVLASSSLVGCGQIAEEGTERIAEGQSGVDDVEINDGEVTISGEDGSFVTGGGDLADGFPEDEVPLYDGELLSSAGSSSGGTTGYSALFQTDASVDDVEADVVAALEGAGYEIAETTDVGAQKFVSATGDAWNVQVSIIDGDGGATVTYLVEATGS